MNTSIIAEVSEVKRSDTSMSIYRRFEMLVSESSSCNWLHQIVSIANCSEPNDCINKLKWFHESFSRAFLLSIFMWTWLSLRKVCHSIMQAGCNIYHLLRFLLNPWLRLQHSSLTLRHRRGRHHSRAAYYLHNPWFASFCCCFHWTVTRLCVYFPQCTSVPRVST